MTCPGCQCQLVVTRGVSSVTCGECGQAIAPVFQESAPLGVGMSQQQPLGAVAGASHPEPAPPHRPANPSATLDSSSGFLVRCPLCAALLQPPPFLHIPSHPGTRITCLHAPHDTKGAPRGG